MDDSQNAASLFISGSLRTGKTALVNTNICELSTVTSAMDPSRNLQVAEKLKGQDAVKAPLNGLNS